MDQNPESELDQQSRSGAARLGAGLALRALDCVLNGERAIYASSELTTGPRLYRLLREHGLRRASDLRSVLSEADLDRLLMAPNVLEATTYARQLRERLPGRPLVVTPAPFMAPGWSQADYLALWAEVIRTRVSALYFSDDWQLSSGCIFEFELATEVGLPTFDARGQELDRARAIALVSEAASGLRRQGFEEAAMRLNLDGRTADRLRRGTRC